MPTRQDKKHWERYLPVKRRPRDPADKPEIPRWLRLLLSALTAIKRSALRIEKFLAKLEKFAALLSKFLFSFATIILGLLILSFCTAVIVS